MKEEQPKKNNHTPYNKKYKVANVELLRLTREADAAGMSYGKFVEKMHYNK